jgi:hypothetical protein
MSHQFLHPSVPMARRKKILPPAPPNAGDAVSRLGRLQDEVQNLQSRIQQAHDNDATAHPDLREPDRHRHHAPYSRDPDRPRR